MSNLKSYCKFCYLVTRNRLTTFRFRQRKKKNFQKTKVIICMEADGNDLDCRYASIVDECGRHMQPSPLISTWPFSHWTHHTYGGLSGGQCFCFGKWFFCFVLIALYLFMPVGVDITFAICCHQNRRCAAARHANFSLLTF